MNATRIFVVLSLCSAFAATHAQDRVVTRGQVRSELETAQLLGEVYYGPSGLTQREVFPDRYPGATPVVVEARRAAQDQGKTRAQVRDELVAAQRSGGIVTSFVGRTERELLPARYPAQEAASDHYAVESPGRPTTGGHLPVQD